MALEARSTVRPNLGSARVAREPAPSFVSIIMPCLNEEAAVTDCVEQALGWLNATQTRGEVIVVDNGSADASAARAAAAGARVVNESARGYGHALLRGIAEARGDVLVMGDCDGTYDFGNLTALIQPLRDGYDVSIGNRYSGGIAQGAMTWSHRYIGTPVISMLLQIFAGVQHGDSQCGLRAFTRRAVEALDLRSGGMEFASEMLLKASRRHLRVAEVPITYEVRIGETKLRTMPDGWRHLRFLLLATPTWLYLIPGLLLAALGIATVAWSFLPSRSVDVGQFHWQPVFAGPIFLIVGINALALGLVSRMHTDAIGLTSPGPLSRFYRRWVSFERLAATGGLLVLAGVAVDIMLFWLGEVRGVLLTDRQALASLAQMSIIAGANLVLAGGLGGLLRND